MDQSLSLLSAQVHILDTELALIHIPLPLYAAFVQPILQLVVPSTSSPASPNGLPNVGEAAPGLAGAARPRVADAPFVNVSLTPIECSIACSRELVEALFVPVFDALDEATRSQVVISSEDYIVVQVDGEGEALEAGQRVVELTAPLALNGISLFFISTYFSDYILVPRKSRDTVIQALEERSFIFEQDTETFVNLSSPLLPSGSRHQHHHSRSSSSATPAEAGFNPFDAALSPSHEPRPPQTPPPSSAAEVEARTFALLRRRDIQPAVDHTLRLVQRAARRETLPRSSSGAAAGPASPSVMLMRLQLGLMRCVIRSPRPRFFSVTLTESESASLLLEEGLLGEFFGAAGDDDMPLLGSTDTLVPVVFDFRHLPMQSTGIVCGVAGRLVGGMRARPGGSGGGEKRAPVEMSYLSTAMSGTVLVAEEDLDDALEALARDKGSPGFGDSPGGAGQGGASTQTESIPIPIRPHRKS